MRNVLMRNVLIRHQNLNHNLIIGLITLFMKRTIFSISFLALAFWACKPERDNDFQLSATVAAPEISVEFVAGDSNRVIVKDLSSGNYQRIWDFPGGTPKTSTLDVDTVYYETKGEYAITLFVTKTDGSGSPSNTKKVTVPNDAFSSLCGPAMAKLTGNCNVNGKCWTLTHEAGAVKVGPNYGDFSWYTSPANGLQDAQYDDGFCFKSDSLIFENRNNGASVDPWDNYNVKPYDRGRATFQYRKGTGTQGADQIILPDDQFMGVWDCDNVLDIIKLTNTELVVRGRQRNQSGAPLAQGWFELRFVPQ